MEEKYSHLCWEVRVSADRPMHIYNHNFIVVLGFGQQMEIFMKPHFVNTIPPP